MEKEQTKIQRAECSPENTAYVIYTSGSTGKPKGVVITHRNATALLYWARDQFTSEELSCVLASTSICFDLSVFELFAPLSWGGKVILAENALSLTSLPADDQVSLINTVPSAMTELLRLRALPSSVRTVNLAGEVLQKALAEQIHAQGAVRRLYNLYGPSEDTTYSTASIVSRESEKPLIGRPIANTHVYVLDRQLEVVPVGVSGELYIAGEGLARGYLHRPELTAERFIPNPFATQHGARMYRTGDIVRYVADGELEFLGRADHQVKIRGYRIELGEIEAVLAAHPAVSSAAVLVREDQPQHRQLIAYFVVDDAAKLAVEQLRQHVAEQLPDYMVPALFVQLEQMPLTPNGKVDRSALPDADAAMPQIGGSYVAPRSATEQVVAAIWREVLGVERVGVTDNFFQLGGHSLLATRMIVQVREALRVEISLRDLFEAPTVERLSEVMIERQSSAGRTEKIATLYRRIQQMSAEDVRRSLQEKGRS